MRTINKAAQKLVFVIAFLFFINCAAKEQEKQTVTIEEERSLLKNTAEIKEDLPEIIGTSWSLLSIYEKGTKPKFLHNFPDYLFCNNGRWELHSLTVSAGQMGTYKIKGNRLTIVHDGADKLTGNYTITWNAAEKYLELDDGKLIFRLRYRTKTKC